MEANAKHEKFAKTTIVGSKKQNKKPDVKLMKPKTVKIRSPLIVASETKGTPLYECESEDEIYKNKDNVIEITETQEDVNPYVSLYKNPVAEKEKLNFVELQEETQNMLADLGIDTDSVKSESDFFSRKFLDGKTKFDDDNNGAQSGDGNDITNNNGLLEKIEKTMKKTIKKELELVIRKSSKSDIKKKSDDDSSDDEAVAFKKKKKSKRFRKDAYKPGDIVSVTKLFTPKTNDTELLKVIQASIKVGKEPKKKSSKKEKKASVPVNAGGFFDGKSSRKSSRDVQMPSSAKKKVIEIGDIMDDRLEDYNNMTKSQRRMERKLQAMESEKRRADKLANQIIVENMNRSLLSAPAKYYSEGLVDDDRAELVKYSKGGRAMAQNEVPIASIQDFSNSSDVVYELKAVLSPDDIDKIISACSKLSRSIFYGSKSTRTGALVFDGVNLLLAMSFHPTGRELGMGVKPVTYQMTLTFGPPESTHAVDFKKKWTFDFDDFLKMLKLKYDNRSGLMLLVTSKNILIIAKENVITDDLINEASLLMTSNDSGMFMTTNIYDKFEVIFAFLAVDFLKFIKADLKTMTRGTKGTKIRFDLYCTTPYDTNLYFVLDATVADGNDMTTVSRNVFPIKMSQMYENPDSGMKFDYNFRRSFVVEAAYLFAININLEKKKDSDVGIIMSIKEDTVPYIDLYYNSNDSVSLSYRLLINNE